MRLISSLRSIATRIVVALSLLLVLGCAGTGDGLTERLTGRLTAVNLMAATTAQGLASATKAGVIVPGSATASVIDRTLDAVELSLDSAGSALRAGLPDMASRNLDAAETQLTALLPLLPPAAGGQ